MTMGNAQDHFDTGSQDLGDGKSSASGPPVPLPAAMPRTQLTPPSAQKERQK